MVKKSFQNLVKKGHQIIINLKMESNDASELYQLMQRPTETYSDVLCRLVRSHANYHSISTLNEALCFAEEKGVLNSLQLLIEAGFSPNTSFVWNEDKPLHICSADRQATEMVRELLKHGADVNAENGNKRTPLHEASSNDCVENMQELLKNGATVDAQDEDGKTPLIHLMQSSPQVSTVQVLLDAGANVNLSDERGRTPLHYAVRKELPQIVRLLLRHNADANVRDDRGDTPLHVATAVRKETCEIMRELLKCGARLNELNNHGHSAFYYSHFYLNEEATQELLHWGAAFGIVECLQALERFASKRGPHHKSIAITQELVRYVFINCSDSLESIRQQLRQDRIACFMRGSSSLESNLEKFKYACLFEVEALSKMSCDCGKSSIWGSINNCEECSCDSDQAILKFLFSGRRTNFMDAFFRKLSKECLLEVILNLMSYQEFKESEKPLILPWPCRKIIERYVSFEDLMSFLQGKQSEMGASEFEMFLEFNKGISFNKSSI